MISMHFCFRILLILTPLIFNCSVGSPSLGRALRSTINHVHPDEYVSPCTPLFFNQTLNHFSPGHQIYFHQKYFLVSENWGGPPYPIFVYMEGEQSLSEYECRSVGFFWNTVKKFRPLLLFVEHRYYGYSIPFNSREEALRDISTLRYLSSKHALADIENIITFVKTEHSADDSPVIVFGGSYAGNLAAWMRLKYPKLVLGALASSAPLLYFDGVTPSDGYDKVVSRDFKEISENCYISIRQSWDKIDEVAVKVNGLPALSRQFNTCSPLQGSWELKSYLEHLYNRAAQYNAFSIEKFCNIVDEGSPNSNLLHSIALAVADALGNNCLEDDVELNSNDQATVEQANHLNSSNDLAIAIKRANDRAWGWQSCTDQVMPMGRRDDTMFQPRPFNWAKFRKECRRKYGLFPRPRWAITQYYNGTDPKKFLRRHASNIIFSNGLQDPYSSGGVLKNLSDTLIAITAKKGYHCFDLDFITSDSPEWKREVRFKEVQIIKSWLHKHYRHFGGMIGRPRPF